MENLDVIAVMSTDASLGKSILTSDEASPIDVTKPISVCSITKEYDLKQCFILERTFSSFERLYQNFGKINIPFVFGLELTVCADMAQKDEESFKTESKVNIWMKNSAGYKDLIKFYTKAATDSFYYVPRLDYNYIINNWSDNLVLTIPFYGSFLHNNYLKNSNCIPSFGSIKPTFFLDDKKLPWDTLLTNKIKSYCEAEKYETQQVSAIRYYSRSDFKSFMVFHCMHNRTRQAVFQNPKKDGLHSDNFAFQDYCEKSNIIFKH